MTSLSVLSRTDVRPSRRQACSSEAELNIQLPLFASTRRKLMKKHFVIAALMSLTVATTPAWSADTAATQAKLQTASIPAMRQSIASAAGYELKSIEIKHNAHKLTATIVNSKQNRAASADREKEALEMVSSIEREIAGKPEFAGVVSIHIDYISRLEKKVKTVQIFDFFRSPANAFVLHKS
jgi:hypothetical protein